MKNKFKNISLLIMVILIISLITGCESDDIEQSTNLKTTVAQLEEKLSEDDDHDLVFKIDNKLVKLKLMDEDELDELEEEEIYTIAYDESSNTLKSLSLYDFEYVADPEVEYAEEEPIATGEKGNPIAISEEKVDTEGLTLMDSFEYDFSGEETMDEIALYSTAEEDEDGELMLDDGGQWTLLARTESGDFVLFDDYVSMGKVQFKVLTKDDGFYVVMIQDDTANLQVVEYHFEEETNTFVPYKNYQIDGNINMLY